MKLIYVKNCLKIKYFIIINYKILNIKYKT